MDTVILVCRFLVPCWIINIGLNIFNRLPWLSKLDEPFDCGKNFFDGRRILGDSTTRVGFFVAIFLGVICEVFLTDWWLGILKGLLVFFGHAVGSFIKRWLAYERGEFLPFVDHGDYVILTSLVFYFSGLLTISIVVWSIVVNYFVHPFLCYLGFKLGLREKKDLS